MIDFLHFGRRKLVGAGRSFVSTSVGAEVKSFLGRQANQFAQPAIDHFFYEGAYADAVYSVKNGRSFCLERSRAEPEVRRNLERFLAHVFQTEFEQLKPHLDEMTERLVRSWRTPQAMRRDVSILANFDREEAASTRRRKKPLKKSRLRILVVSGLFPSVDHGGGLRLFDIVTELSKRHEIEMYAIYNEELDQKSMLRMKDRIQAMRLVNESSFSFPDLVDWLERRGKSITEFDAIQFEYPHSVPIIVDCIDQPATSVFTLMEGVTRRFSIDLLFFMNSSPERIPELLKGMLTHFNLEKTALQSVDHGVAVSAADADFAARVFKVKRPTVISTGISPELFAEPVNGAIATKPDLAPRAGKRNRFEKSAAFLGYYGHTPNIEGMEWYLTKVHPKVKAQIPDFKIYVIGRGDTSQLESLVPDGDQSVEFTGRVESIIEWLVKARICLLPLHTGSGLRGKINQYSAAGRPSVSTSVGICGTAYVNGVSVLEADDADKFADCMVKLINDEQLWGKIQKASEELVIEHCSWPSLIVDLEKLYVI